MQGKINIEVLNKDKVVLHVTDTQGRRISKMVTAKAAAAALAGPNGENKDSGLIPQNILRIWENSQYKGYLIYQRSRAFQVQYRGGEPYQVKLPGIVMKAVASANGNFLREKSSIFICDGNEINPSTKLWDLKMNNYNPSYGVCWGQNEDSVNEIMKRGDLFDIEQLPQIFFGSIFNADLHSQYHFTDAIWDKIKPSASNCSSENSTVRYFAMKYDTGEDFDLSSEILDPHRCLVGGVMM